MSILAFKIWTKGDWVKEMYILDIKSNRTMNFILEIIIIIILEIVWMNTHGSHLGFVWQYQLRRSLLPLSKTLSQFIVFDYQQSAPFSKL